MDPNHDDKHPEADQPVDLDSAIEELEGLLSSHDKELHQAAYPDDDIPVLLDVVEPPTIAQYDFDLTGEPPADQDPEPLLQEPGREREPILPFEFIDDLTPAPDPAPTAEFTDTIPEFELEPESGSTYRPEPGRSTVDTASIPASEPETMAPDLPSGETAHPSQASPGELTPQLLDELETIIDQELLRITAEAKQSILATLRAHLDECGQSGPDIAMGAEAAEHFPASAPDAEPQPGPEEAPPPLRPFDPCNDPD